MPKILISKNTKLKSELQEKFEKYYKGIPDDVLTYIFDNYIKKFPDSLNDIAADSLCTAFELLFTLGAMLVDDNNDWICVYFLGFKKYKKMGTHNPYDYSWFEEEISNTHEDILEYLQKIWLPDHEDEFKKIYDICEKYKRIMTLESIVNYYDKVECN